MSRLSAFAVVLSVAGLGILLTATRPSAVEAKTEAAEKAAPKTVLRHVVLFKFKKTATKEQVQHVVDEFAKLPSKIDTIIAFEKGTDVSVENKSKGFTHAFVVTFNDAKGREVYLPHPAHKAFVKIVGPVIEDVLVFDYTTPAK